MLLALLLTKEGLPLGYHVYNGVSLKTIRITDALAYVERMAEVEWVVFVTDSGLLLSVETGSTGALQEEAHCRHTAEELIALKASNYEQDEPTVVNEIAGSMSSGCG